ncbi:activating signal cointegrator 1 complex subunit 2 [Phtheirospermum japonicum]|uniref:Activating signal cointegrator 1 complex subunit 2 n=1 Tax=Phtheirospermum japonicum TaxID=374723 RepID=A0A830CHA5_9LAMI|nr:activating signal cointegrator 1 complex subunit 2 [Phtheirospermum japonicum]
MSNRFIRNDSKNTPKPQQKYTPKRDSQNPDPQKTLSNSLRAATAATNTVRSGGDAVMSSTSRVKMGKDGEWASKVSTRGNFVVYLPQDDAVAAGLGPEEGGLDPVESQRVVDLLNRELSRLLKLRPRDFWREVATDESLHVFLESFLKFRSRWYDFPHRGARGIVAGVIVGEFELCRRVFMVLYRLSSNRDPGAKAADSLSSKEHEGVNGVVGEQYKRYAARRSGLNDKKLLDLPKLLDICAIFGYENEDLTRVLVMNALKAQPDIELGFTVLLSHFLSIVQTMFQRCSSSLEVLLSSGCHQDLGSNRLHLDYLEVMDFINDSVVSLDSFVNADKHAAVFFSLPVEMGYGNEELLVMLARLHDSLLPSLHKGFRILLGVAPVKNKDLLSNVFTSLKMLSTRIAKLGWKLLYFCYLSDEAFESSIYSLPVSMKMFPATVDDPVVRADILIQMVRDLNSEHAHVVGEPTWGTFIQDIEKNFKMTSRIELLQNAGWLSLDNEQFQWLSAITMTQPHADTKKTIAATSLPAATTTKLQTDEDVAIIESKISQIKELFPDYGRGFLIACLEAYNHDPEEVIQRILEETLHKELQSLDSSLETIPPSKPASSVITNSRDKGKGKLVEHPVVGPTVERTQPAVISSGSSSSSFGRFVRKNTNDVSDSETLNAQNDKELAKTAALASQLEYEDEYDDSFDDLGLSVGDSGLDEPNEKMSSRKADNDESSSNATDSSKWGSRKKPQFYVKDGKNYSYKVEGSVAASNYNEARIVNQAQREQIHGLGRGGNLPLGAVRRLTELNEEQNDELLQGGGGGDDEVGRRGRGGGGGGGRGRGRRGFFSSSSGGGVRASGESNEGQEEGGDNNDDDVGGGRGRGGGRRGGSRGRGGNNFRKARAMSKQLTGLPGHYR